MKKTIVFDIDGTLANLDHRLHLVNGTKKNWKEFLARVKDDLPINQTIYLNGLLGGNSWPMYSFFDIVLSSGRSENERKDTEEWLAKYGVKYHQLYMRRAEDYRADYVVKREMLDQMRADGREPWIVFDDRQSVVDMWRKEGLFVLQCAPKETFLDQYDFHKALEFPLTLMVGPSGAGKSSMLAKAMVESDTMLHGMVISSDAIRDMYCGDFRDQSQNERVFETIHEMAKTRLRLGLPTIIDSTNIRTADRVKAAKLLPDNFPVQYIVVDRPLDEKLKTGGWRNDVTIKGQNLVEKHNEVFKANLKAILNGDGLPNVTVKDLRV